MNKFFGRGRHLLRARIRGDLREGAVDPNRLALCHGITPRYLQMLFERDGTTFSEFVLMERLN